jgi:hypothetical protein
MVKGFFEDCIYHQLRDEVRVKRGAEIRAAFKLVSGGKDEDRSFVENALVDLHCRRK